MRLEAIGDEVMTITDRIEADGSTRHAEVGGRMDGREVPVTNNPNGDTAIKRRLDENTFELIYKKDGKVTVVNTGVLSADRKTLRIVVQRMLPNGGSRETVLIYERQER
jgi:hypothetical protein